MQPIILRFFFCFAVGALPAVSSATELVLNEGEIIDLASSKTATRSFAFDKVVLRPASLILIPASMRSVRISINELHASGTSYILVYDDMAMAPPPPPLNQGKATVCAGGAQGVTGARGREGHAGLDLDLTIGFSVLDQVVVFNPGLQGGPGQDGGKGQDGGDSGGRERCVVQRCHGGRGGDSGRGGAGGTGGRGGNVVLNYSGIEAGRIVAIQADWAGASEALYRALIGIAPRLREKRIDGYDNRGKGLAMLQAMIGQAIAGDERRTDADPGTLDPAARDGGRPRAPELKKGFNVILAGGPGGGGGRSGPPGVGGAGYYCTIGPNQDPGPNGTWSMGVGASGAAGDAGKLVSNKLD